MTTPQIVKPEQIESTLQAIWEKLAKEDKMRACLFNLIVFNRYSSRTDYIQNIVQKVIEKFPCRLIFISEDPKPKQNYLKAAVSVIMPEGEKGSVACDHIDIGVSGDMQAQVPYLIRSHILPDLPVTLLWAEDPCAGHSLFEPLSKMATRIIFDSESADNLLSFSTFVLNLKKNSKIDLADLNWGRTEGWRDLITSLFESEERQDHLRQLSELKITYNGRVSEFFCHTKIQSMYLLSWLSSRLEWNFLKSTENLQFEFKQAKAQIESVEWEKIGSGCLLAVELQTANGQSFKCLRIKEKYHLVSIHISSEEKCDLPYKYTLGTTATGQSLVKEICMKGTSKHYLDTLKQLQVLDKDKLC